MRILMFGWEFPPFMSGGLGTACFGMTRALAALGHEITFVLPRAGETAEPTHVRLVPASGTAAPEPGREEPFVFRGLSIRSVDSVLRPYLSGAAIRPCCPVRPAPGSWPFPETMGPT